MFALKEETKKNISLNVGLSFEEVCLLDSASDMGKTVEFPIEHSPLTCGRGNPYLANLRFSNISEEEKLMKKMIEDFRHASCKSKRNRKYL